MKNNKTPVVGLTGSLATGKTTVTQMFKALGAKIIDADKISHQLIQKGEACFKPVVKEFGPDIIVKGEIDRKMLAKIVFNDSKKLDRLIQIIHPRVKVLIKEEIKKIKKLKNFQIIIVDVPLLFESGLDQLMDQTIAVKANQNKQVERAVARLDITPCQARKRIRSQMPQREKNRLADHVIDNNKSIRETQKQVTLLWDRLKRNSIIRRGSING